jgi:repressor LexA
MYNKYIQRRKQITMTLGDKIKKLRKKVGLTQAELAKKLKVAPTAVSAWERNDNRPLMDKLSILAGIFDVSISYFFNESEVDEAPEVYQVSSTTDLPIVGRISCGNGIIAYQDIEGYEPTPRTWLNGGKYFYLRANGDSMTGARINDGDLLLIRQQEDVEDGEIAAVYVEGEAKLKRVFKRDGNLILQSENAKYPPQIIKSGDVKIIGKLKKLVVAF